MPHRVADELIRRLAEAGVERIYGVVGDSLNPVTDALRLNNKVKWVHVRNEEAGAFAAGAEAQLTGKLAACGGSCGPGNLHLINGLFDAHRSNAPVLAIASHIPSSEIGTAYFQETHPQNLFQECSYYCELISNTLQFERVLHAAMQSALGQGGVGVIVLPGDIAAADLPPESAPRSLVGRRPSVRPGDKDLARLADLINSSKKVALFCGIGCDNAHDEVVALAEKVKAPVAHSYRGKPFVEYDNPYDVGMTGMIGYGMAYEAIHECDLLLLVGTDFPYDKFLPAKTKIAQIDIRVERLGRRSRLDLGIWGDVRETLQALLPLLNAKQDREYLDTTLRKHKEKLRKMNVYVDHVGKRTPMHPEPVAAALSEVAAPDAIFTADTGMCNGTQFDNNAQIGTPNYFPDLISKATYDSNFLGRHLHAEIAGVFTGAHATVQPIGKTSFESRNAYGGGGQIVGNYELIPNKLVILANAFWSDGGAHYLVATGPQLVVRPNAAGTDVSLSMVHAGAGSAGLEWRANQKEAFAAYYAADYYGRNFFPDTTNTAHPGTIIGYGGPGSSNINNRAIQEVTFDWLFTFWKSERHGAFQYYAQYSYLTRSPWFVAPGDPKNAHLSMVYTGVRYVLPSTSGVLLRVPYPN